LFRARRNLHDSFGSICSSPDERCKRAAKLHGMVSAGTGTAMQQIAVQRHWLVCFRCASGTGRRRAFGLPWFVAWAARALQLQADVLSGITAAAGSGAADIGATALLSGLLTLGAVLPNSLADVPSYANMHAPAPTPIAVPALITRIGTGPGSPTISQPPDRDAVPVSTVAPPTPAKPERGEDHFPAPVATGAAVQEPGSPPAPTLVPFRRPDSAPTRVPAGASAAGAASDVATAPPRAEAGTKPKVPSRPTPPWAMVATPDASTAASSRPDGLLPTLLESPLLPPLSLGSLVIPPLIVPPLPLPLSSTPLVNLPDGDIPAAVLPGPLPPLDVLTPLAVPAAQAPVIKPSSPAPLLPAVALPVPLGGTLDLGRLLRP
jgi:hypothetical protein